MAKAKCIARKGSGDPCGNWPVRGALVCTKHGGNAPQVRAKAARRLQEEKAQKVLIDAVKDAPPMESMGDVYAELLQVAGIARVWRQILGERVGDLKTLGYQGFAAEQVRADVQLFEKAMDRSAKISETIARLNIDERKAKLDEAIADKVFQAVQRILNDLELTPEQQERASTVAPKRLRELSA